MKKIFGLSIAALLVLGLVGGGTWAYFSDPESTGNNVFTAGTLDLDFGGGDEQGTVMFNLTNKAPGDNSAANASLSYPATNAVAELDAAFSAVNNVGLASGGGNEFGDDSGDLGAALEIAPFIDLDENGIFDGSDIALGSSTDNTSTSALQWDYLDNFANNTWDDIYSGASLNGTSDLFVIQWRIGTGVGNSIQGDSANFSITFTLEQPAAD